MSGKRVAPTGDITLRTAPASASNAIFEVFGTPVGNNLVALAGSNVDPGTRPPPYTVASTVPTAGSGNLKMSFFAGKSVFLIAPTTLNISNITGTTVTPTLSGGGGTSYQIAIGTSLGTSNTVAWRVATTGTQITGLTFATRTPYYISAYASNTTNSTASLAVSNTTAYGIPDPATGVNLTISGLSSWSFSWTAPANLTVAPTGYSWYLSTISNSIAGAIASGTTAAGTTTTGAQTTTLSGGSTYYGHVLATRPESQSTLASSAGVDSLAAPTLLNFIDALPTTLDSTTTTTVRLSWTASAGVGVTYQVYVGGAASGGRVSTTYKDFAIGSASWNAGFIQCYVVPYIGASAGPASLNAYIAVYTTVGSITPSMPASFNSKWTVSLSGGRGGGGTGNGGYGTTIQTSTSAKYSSNMSLYIANSTRGTYGGTGPTTTYDGGDMSKFAFGGVYAIAGGGGANGTGGGGGGGSTGGGGGQSDTGFTFNYNCCGTEYQQIGIGGGLSGGDGGAGGSGFYADAGGAYWNSQGGQDGFASSGNTGGNGRNYYGYGGAGGGGWVGGGGGGAGTGQAGNYGQRINCGSGGGAGSSGATAGFAAVSTYQGSTTSARYSGFAIIGSYNDGT